MAQPAPAKDSSGTVYVCPMHAEVRSSQPGHCPKCGMDLVPQPATPPPQNDGAGEQSGAHGDEHVH
jgi:hypothetical protein